MSFVQKKQDDKEAQTLDTSNKLVCVPRGSVNVTLEKKSKRIYSKVSKPFSVDGRAQARASTVNCAIHLFHYES